MSVLELEVIVLEFLCVEMWGGEVKIFLSGFFWSQFEVFASFFISSKWI